METKIAPAASPSSEKQNVPTMESVIRPLNGLQRSAQDAQGRGAQVSRSVSRDMSPEQLAQYERVREVAKDLSPAFAVRTSEDAPVIAVFAKGVKRDDGGYESQYRAFEIRNDSYREIKTVSTKTGAPVEKVEDSPAARFGLVAPGMLRLNTEEGVIQYAAPTSRFALSTGGWGALKYHQPGLIPAEWNPQTNTMDLRTNEKRVLLDVNLPPAKEQK